MNNTTFFKNTKDAGKANQDIRAYIAKSGLKKWEVAELLGITDTWFSIKLRHEMTSEQKNTIINLIAEEVKRRNDTV